MTNLELIRELKKPGKVCMPVIGPDDVFHIRIDKSDLLLTLEGTAPDELAPWCFYGEFDGARRLDVQNKEI